MGISRRIPPEVLWRGTGSSVSVSSPSLPTCAGNNHREACGLSNSHPDTSCDHPQNVPRDILFTPTKRRLYCNEQSDPNVSSNQGVVVRYFVSSRLINPAEYGLMTQIITKKGNFGTPVRCSRYVSSSRMVRSSPLATVHPTA